MARTLVCVPILVDDADAALKDAALAKDLGADVVEWRIDGLAQDLGNPEAAQAATRLVGESPLPSILTCRSASQGGRFEGSGEDVASLLSMIDPETTGISGHVDVEMELLKHSGRLRQSIGRRATNASTDSQRVILSHHDLGGRPVRLFEFLGAMRSHDEASVLKLAWTGRSLRDNLEAFELLLERDRPMIVLVMGEAGILSRVLSAKFGGFLTFAALRAGAGTAPGQPTLGELLDLYRFRSIGPATKTCGIVGWPVAHSISPQVHNAGFEARGVDGVYLPMPVAPGWEPFKATVLSLIDWKPLDLWGLSVTKPHKEHLVRLALEDASRQWVVDDIAERLGAANTLVVSDDGTLRVANTDVAGIVAPLRTALESQGRSLERARVAVIGAGGAARAAAAGLAIQGAHVCVFARRREQGEELAREINSSCKVDLEASGGALEAGDWTLRAQPDRQIFVNCTPIGMYGGDTEKREWISEPELDGIACASEDSLVFDTVYRPFMTPTLVAAESRKLLVIPGLSMFVEQAAAQFKLWTGRAAPRELLERVARETLQAQGA